MTFTEKAAGELKLRLRDELERGAGSTTAGGGRRRARSAAALAEPRGGARQHHPRLLRRPAARAPGRGAASIRVSRADRAAGAGAVRRRVQRLVAGAARGAAARRPPRAAAAQLDDDGPIGRLERAGVDAGRLARLHRAVDEPATFDQVAPRRRADRRGDRAFAAISERLPSAERRALSRTPSRARRLAGEVSCSEQVAAARLRRAGGAARGLDWLRSSWSRGRGRRHGAFRQGRARASTCSTGTRRSLVAHSRSSSATPTPTSRRACTRSCARHRRLRSGARRARRARFPRPAAPRARPGARSTPTCAPRSSSGSAPVRRRVPGHRSAPGRDPAAAGGRRSAPRPTGARSRPAAGQAVRRRRPEAVDLPVPPRRRRHLPRRCASSCGAHGAACVRAAQQLPRRAGHPARRQRRVRAAHDRRRRSPAGALRAAGGRCGRRSRASRRSSRCRCRGRTDVATAADEAVARRVAAATRSPRSSTGWCSDSGWTVTDASGPTRARADPGRATSACCSGASHASRRTDVDVTRPYVQALEARGVPHLLVGGKSFHEREEVEALRTALAAIEWPDDELSVFAHAARPAVRVRRRGAARLPARVRGSFRPFRPLETGARRARSRCARSPRR